jgi:ABC-2 type transport system permease protein
MWFRNVFLKTLREYRIAILGWGIGLGLLMYVVLSAVESVMGSAQAKAALVSLAKSYAWLAEPVQIATPGGYATWKYGFTILIMALWPLLAGSRMLRGEEERGSMDALLSQPQGRVSTALQKLAAMWVALFLMGFIIAVFTYLGGIAVKADYGFGGAFFFGFNLTLVCGVFGSLALFISQFTRERRTAAGITGGLLVLAIVVDMVHRIVPNTDWFSRLSPVYYYNLSKPLIPSYGTDPVALLVMLLISVVLSGAAVWIFARRDVGEPVALPAWLQRPQRAVPLEKALPANAWSLKSLYARGLAQMRVGAFWWTVVIAGLGAWFVVIAMQTETQLKQLFESSPELAKLIGSVGGSDVNFNASLLSFMFLFLPILLMAFAVTQASRWASDEEDGLQELVLATPQPRWRVILARFGALTTVTIIIALVTLAALALAASLSGFALDGGNLVAASLTMIPMGLLVAALGYFFSGWLRMAIDTGLLSFLLVAWVVITFFGGDLNFPDPVMRLSALYYFGTPLVNGLPLGGMFIIIAVAAVALALATFRFMRKDIAAA